jgi:hypothetical protein
MVVCVLLTGDSLAWFRCFDEHIEATKVAACDNMFVCLEVVSVVHSSSFGSA